MEVGGTQVGEVTCSGGVEKLTRVYMQSSQDY